MNSFLRAFVLCAAIALTATGGAFAHNKIDKPRQLPAQALDALSRAPAKYSYAQAKALGLDVDSAKRSGLSECPLVPYIDEGITSEEDAEVIAIMQNRKDAPRCYSPVQNMKFGVGTPAPHTGSQIPGYPNSYYHWTGWNTFVHNQWGAGIQFQIEVVDPSVVPFSSGYEFVAARVMNVDEEGQWTEAGWYEYNYFTGNNQCAYGYATPENVHHFDCDSYPLTVGSMYTFRTEQVAPHDEDGFGGFIYYAGIWRMLVYNDAMFCAMDPSWSYCHMEVALEVETDVDPDRHVILNGGDYDDVGVTFHLGKVKKVLDDTWNSVSTYNNCANMEINNDSPTYRMVKRGTFDIRNSFRVSRTGTTHDTCP